MKIFAHLYATSPSSFQHCIDVIQMNVCMIAIFIPHMYANTVQCNDFLRAEYVEVICCFKRNKFPELNILFFSLRNQQNKHTNSKFKCPS